MSETVFVTGAAGMIGAQVVRGLLAAGYTVVGADRRSGEIEDVQYRHLVLDLADADAVAAACTEQHITRVIHLAALAHTAGETDLSYETYYRINVVCAKNVFEAAKAVGATVLYISTVDVYGFVKGAVNGETVPHPVTVYGKTKYLGEQALRETGGVFDIYRFAPVYTDTVKRDIQKRYYFKYPNLAYIIGSGEEYEFLYIDTAVAALVDWVGKTPTGRAYNIKDAARVSTAACLSAERTAGRAKHILHFPRWLVHFGFGVVFAISGKNKYTYLLNKAVHPLRTE